MSFIHKNLSQGRWQELSFAEQIGNIGSELSRAKSWSVKGNNEYKIKSLERALELIDLTLSNREERTKIKELTCLHQVVSSLLEKSDNSITIFKSLESFYLPFALLARQK